MNCRLGLSTIFVQQFGYEEDVVGAREDGKGENCSVDSGQVVTATLRNAGRKNNRGNCTDLYCGIDFSKPGGTKTAKPCNDIDSSSPHKDKYVTANDRDGHPKRHREVCRQGLGKYTPHGQDYKRRYQHQFIGNGIENGP